MDNFQYIFFGSYYKVETIAKYCSETELHKIILISSAILSENTLLNIFRSKTFFKQKLYSLQALIMLNANHLKMLGYRI